MHDRPGNMKIHFTSLGLLMLKFFIALIGLFWRVLLIVGGLVLGSLWNAAWAFFTSPMTDDEESTSISCAYDAHTAFQNGEIGMGELQYWCEQEEDL
jgi:hypothetical protein